MDLVKHFPSIDHAILTSVLGKVVLEDDLWWLIETIIASGDGVLDDQYTLQWFPGDDLLAVLRPRGLPIGNLTTAP